MSVRVALPRPVRWETLGWAAAALLLGVLAGRIPLIPLLGGLALAGLLVAAWIEPALAVILMLCLAPLKTLIATEAPLPLPLDLGQIAFALVIGLWVMLRATRLRWEPLPRTPLLVPLVVILLGFGLSLFAAQSAGAWLAEYLKWIEMLLLVLVVLDLGRGRRWTWIAAGLVLAGVLQAIIGVYEFFGGSGAPHLWIANFQRFRAFGTFGQPNPFSAFMGLTLPLALGLAWGCATQSYHRWRNGAAAGWRRPALGALIYAVAGMLLLAGLIASWGRGAWLGFGAAGTVMVFLAPRARWQGILLAAGAGMLVLVLWLSGTLPASIEQRIARTVDEFVGFGDVRAVPVNNDNFAIVERLAHWQAAYYMANDHPLIGVGLGNYEVVYPRYGLPSWPRALGHAHNDYLNILAETGLIGLAAYLGAWALIVRLTLRALEQPDYLLRGLVLGLLGSWVHLGVHSIVDKLYVNNLFLHVGVMLGLLAAALDQRRYSVEAYEHDILRFDQDAV